MSTQQYPQQAWPSAYPVAAPKKARRWPWVAGIVVAFLAGLLFGSLGNTGAVAPSAQASPPVTSPSAAYVPPPNMPPAADSTDVATLGADSFTYEDGVVVATSPAQTYTPGRYSAGHDNAVAVKVTITVTNNSSKAFDPTMLRVGASYGGAAASQIFDSANGLGSPPQTQVLPGKSISFPVAFSLVDGPGELQVDITPSFSHNSSTFVGPVG